MNLPRASGILLHPTSLPGRFGAGDLGPSAVDFARSLARTGQRWWQMLPVTPAGGGHSPYSGTSSLAGNPLLISPDGLVQHGWLGLDELEGLARPQTGAAEFDEALAIRHRLLRLAFERFDAKAREKHLHAEFDDFSHRESHWLHDFALHEAIRDDSGGLPWNQWPDRGLAAREPAKLRRAGSQLAADVRFHRFVQFVFDLQWRALREVLAADGIGLIGDLPIFVSGDSVDVWVRPDLFQVDALGQPTHVAGVPPDYFNEDGQRWGNPLYRWDAHRLEHFAWWTARVSGTLTRFDLLRMDHFRGFDACFSIPADAPTAADPRCRWEKAPGPELFQALTASLGDDLPLIAEDLGVITPDVEALRDTFGLPGMRVLQFAFGDDPLADVYLPHKFIPHCVAYTGTHDNDTTLGWLTAPPGGTTQTPEQILAERSFVRRYLSKTPDSPASESVLGLLRAAWGSVADTAIAPLQDWLLLGSDGRMNTPGVAEGNWGWRLLPGQWTPEAEHRLAEATSVFGRWNGTVPDSYRTRLGAPMLQSSSSPDPDDDEPPPSL